MPIHADAAKPERPPERRRAQREVARALSEWRTVAIWAGFAVSSQVFAFGLLAASPTLTLGGGLATFAFLTALGARVEPPPEPPPRSPRWRSPPSSDADNAHPGRWEHVVVGTRRTRAFRLSDRLPIAQAHPVSE